MTTSPIPATSVEIYDQIRQRNDALRASIGSYSSLIVTNTIGIMKILDSEPDETLERERELHNIIIHYADFGTDFNPFDEHNSGQFFWRGHQCVWKIEHHDDATGRHSNNPHNPHQSSPYLSIMLADEN